MRNAALSLFALFLSTVCVAAGHDVTRPVPGPSPVGAGVPVMVATNGRTFATLWFRQGQIFGAVADSSGNRISGADILVSPDYVSDSSTAAGTVIGSDFVLYWNNPTGSHITIFDDGLKVKQTIALPDVPLLTYPSIATDGSRILIVGQTQIRLNQTVAYLVDRGGTLLRAPVNLNAVGRVTVSWAGTDFVVAVAQKTELFVERITVDDVKRVNVFSGVPTPQMAAVSSDGDNILVAWSTFDTPQTQTFWSSIIDKAGNVTTHQIDSRPRLAGFPASNAVWNGNDAYVAAFGNVVFTLSRDGVPIGLTVIDHNVTAIAAFRGVVYTAGGDGRDAGWKIAVIFTANQGEYRTEVLSITPAAQDKPAVASDGVDFMTVFNERTATTRSIIAAPIARAFIASAENPIHLADVTAFYPDSAIAHGRSIYLAAWSDAQNVYAKRITNYGAVLDPEPIKISDEPYPSGPEIAWNGDKFLVVWATGAGIAAVTVGEDGSISAKQLLAGNGSLQPRVAWNGKVFLVVYGVPGFCPFECPVFRTATLAVRVAADGTPLDATPATIEEATGNFSVAQRATVASDGRDFLIALDAGGGPALIPVRTDGASIEIGARRIAFEWFGAPFNDIRWSGHDYVLASTYYVPGKSWLALAHLTATGDVYARSVTTVAMPRAVPALAVNSLGESAVVIAEQTPDSPVQRVRAYFDSDFAPAPLPPAPPANVTAIGSPTHFVMSWTVGPDAEGVEVDIQHGGYSTSMFVPANEHSLTFNDPTITSVTLRAVNAGGLSQSVGALLQTPPRRRAIR